MNQERKIAIVVEEGLMLRKLSEDLSGFSEVKIMDAASVEQSLREKFVPGIPLAIHALTGLMLVKPEEIVLFEYLKRCWSVLLTDGNTYKFSINTTASNILDIHPSFSQINQNCVVNLNYLQFIENTTYTCVFRSPFSDITQTVSQRYYKKLRNKLSPR